MTGRIAELIVRYALAAAFLSAVADRLGIWGQPGSANVDWGNTAAFATAVGQLNPWLPGAVVPTFAWAVTIIEILLGLSLVIGTAPRATALASAVLLLLFAVAMTVVLGVKAPLNYSVFTAAAAALLLAETHRSTASFRKDRS